MTAHSANRKSQERKMLAPALRRSGLTLIETVIGIAVLAIISVAIYGGFSAVLDTLNASRVRGAAAAVATEHLELIRNIPYQQIGTVGGIPPGVIPATATATRENMQFLLTTTVRNIDDPFDGTLGGAPNDSAPADYKLVEVSVSCTTCEAGETFVFTGRAAPRALETASTNGALFVQVINASGQSVPGATVAVTNSAVNPAVNVTDTTDAAGFLKLVDVPPAVQSYHIVVSKAGYSSDQTYAISGQNPNPAKPDATVALQTITQISFTIDRTSSVNIASVTSSCSAVASIPFQIDGAKLIGANPPILKFSQAAATDANGLKSFPSIEWDTYAFTFTGAGFDLAGSIPLLPLPLAPNATAPIKAVMEPKNPRALLVTVTDAATGLPLSNTAVTVAGGSVNQTLTTGRGFLRQTDWSGGSGQDPFVDETKYFDQDGNIVANAPAGDLALVSAATSTYAASGALTSSTFDTGSPSTFYQLAWQPAAQPPETGADSVRFQLATATTTAPAVWNFVGPDGTAGSYFTTSNTNANSIHSGDRYFRYRAFLQTASTTFTPLVSDVALTFASDCVPPGQAFFSGLPVGAYTLSLTRAGYQPVTQPVNVAAPWQETVVPMSPNP